MHTAVVSYFVLFRSLIPVRSIEICVYGEFLLPRMIKDRVEYFYLVNPVPLSQSMSVSEILLIEGVRLLDSMSYSYSSSLSVYLSRRRRKYLFCRGHEETLIDTEEPGLSNSYNRM